MKVLITGAHGFVGKNLTTTLKTKEEYEVFEYDLDTDPSLLDKYTKECEFVFHLAGVNRPETEDEFMKGNFGFTSVLLDKLKEQGNKAPVLITSSIQAELDNPYGKSKKAGENLIFTYGRDNGVETFVYRMPNVFGKWCRPNYNSAVATFCNNIANDLPIQVNAPDRLMQLVYVDDVVAEFIRASRSKANKCAETNFCYVEPVHEIKLGEIAELIQSFKESRNNFYISDQTQDSFAKKLYATYLSYLPEDRFAYEFVVHADERGSFTEMLKSDDRGQVSINVAKPGIVKGNHWHHTKNEKFIVVSGEGIIRFRKIGTDKVIEYRVSGNNPKCVDIPTGYTHNIENVGDTDLVTMMWCNECFNPDVPDTFFEKV